MTMDEKQVEIVVRGVLTEKCEDGKTIVEAEVQNVIDGAVRKLTIRFGIAIIVLTFGFGGWVTKLTYDVQLNTTAVRSADRYTKEEHTVYSSEVDRRFAEMQENILQLRNDNKEDISDVKKDLQYIIEKLDAHYRTTQP